MYINRAVPAAGPQAQPPVRRGLLVLRDDSAAARAAHPQRQHHRRVLRLQPDSRAGYAGQAVRVVEECIDIISNTYSTDSRYTRGSG